MVSSPALSKGNGILGTESESLEAQLAAAAARLGEATDTITALNERVTSLTITVEKLSAGIGSSPPAGRQ